MNEIRYLKGRNVFLRNSTLSPCSCSVLVLVPLPLPHALISALTCARIATLDASIRSDPSASEAVASNGRGRAGGMQLRSLHVKFEAHLVLGCD